MTEPIATVSSHNPLTPSDITRLPQGAIGAAPQVTTSQIAAPQTLKEDTFGEPKQESHTLRNTIIGLVIAAAAIVGLKHCKFMQVSDAANMKWYDHPKQWINKLGEWIETPFVWTYKKLFGKGDAAEEALEKGTGNTPKKPSGSKKPGSTGTPESSAPGSKKKPSGSKKPGSTGTPESSAPSSKKTPSSHKNKNTGRKTPSGSKKPGSTGTPDSSAPGSRKTPSGSKKTDKD